MKIEGEDSVGRDEWGRDPHALEVGSGDKVGERGEGKKTCGGGRRSHVEGRRGRLRVAVRVLLNECGGASEGIQAQKTKRALKKKR